MTPKAARKAFMDSPKQEVTKFAQKRRVDMSRAVMATGGRSLRAIESSLLTQMQEETYLDSCNCLLNDLKHSRDRVIPFSDEKTFTVDPMSFALGRTTRNIGGCPRPSTWPLS